MGSLTRSLWPHDVVVYFCSYRPSERTTTLGPLGDYDETRGCRPENDTDFFFETSYTVCTEQTMSHNDDPTILTRPRRADKARSDGLRQQTTTMATRSVGGRVDKPWSKRRWQPHDSTGRATLPGGREKEVGTGLTSRNAAPRPTGKCSFRQRPITTRPTTPDGWVPRHWSDSDLLQPRLMGGYHAGPRSH